MDAAKALYCREWGQIREYKARYCILLSVTAFCSLRPRFSLFDTAFIGTNKHLFEWVCPSVHRSVRQSVSILAFSFLAVSIRLLAPRGQYCRVYGLISKTICSMTLGLALSEPALHSPLKAHYSLLDSVLLSGTAYSEMHFLKKSPIVRYISIPWMFRSIKNFVLWRDFVRLKAFLSYQRKEELAWFRNFWNNIWKVFCLPLTQSPGDLTRPLWGEA